MTPPLSADRNREILSGLPLFGGLEPQALEQLALALDPVHVRGGQALMSEGEPGDAMFILVHGKLRAFARLPDGAEAALGDVSAGDIVGELALLATTARTSTVRALRDSTLLRLTADRFSRFVLEHPAALLQFTRVALARLLSASRGLVPKRKTFAVIPAGATTIPREFQDALLQALGRLGDTLLVTRDRIDQALGSDVARTTPGGPRDAELIAWLHRAEDAHDFLVYEADALPDPWLARCLRQADEVLLVGTARSAAAPSPAELEASRLRPDLFPADAVLILVQESDTLVPAETAQWLAGRSVRSHVHVRRGHEADFRRMARLLTGRGTGLVLSGGVARGFAHVGVLRAIEELAIPVDAVTGVSFGSIVAAGIAMDWDHAQIRDQLILATVTDGSLLDFTMPMAAMTRGARVTHRLKRAFGGVHIEDLWRPYSCVSSDLSTVSPHVHTRGPAWSAMRASVSLPGVFPPVRSPEGTVLLDGSLTNGLPVDILKEILRGGRIIAVDLTAPARFQTDDLPEDGVLSGWSAWLARLNPLRRSPRVPSIMHVLAGATMLGSTLSRAARVAEADLVLTPPVDGIGLLRFDRYEEAIEAGYRHAMERLPEWVESAPRSDG